MSKSSYPMWNDSPTAPAKDTSETPKTGDSGTRLWTALLAGSLTMLLLTGMAIVKTQKENI